jgi:hypothetical protein
MSVPAVGASLKRTGIEQSNKCGVRWYLVVVRDQLIGDSYLSPLATVIFPHPGLVVRSLGTCPEERAKITRGHPRSRYPHRRGGLAPWREPERWAQQYGFDRALVITGSMLDDYLRRATGWRLIRQTRVAAFHARCTADQQ